MKVHCFKRPGIVLICQQYLMGNFLRNLIRDLYAFLVGHGVTFLMGHLDRDLVTMGLGDIMTFLKEGDKNVKASP